MLIRIRGGDEGIKEYLETGRKQGREFSRDMLDERAVLYGDLEKTEALINRLRRAGERYLHITLSFKEDEVDRATLEGIANDFREFAMAAYEPD